MVRELGQARPRLVTVERLERLHRTSVEAHSPGAREPVVHRVTNQNVGEAKAAGCAGHIGDNASGERLVERVEQLVRHAAQAGQRVERELAADHGCEHEHPRALGREVEPARDHVADALRDGN